MTHFRSVLPCFFFGVDLSTEESSQDEVNQHHERPPPMSETNIHIERVPTEQEITAKFEQNVAEMWKADREELDHLRTENQSLREQVERFRNFFMVQGKPESVEECLIRWRTETYLNGVSYAAICEVLKHDLQAHKQALEKARVSLEACQDYITGKSQWVALGPLTNALSTINQILNKPT